MREVKKKRVRVVDGKDAAGFEASLNSILDGITEPNIVFDSNRPFLAYVTYEEFQRIPESVRDAYELRGEYHYCGECPYYKPPTDKRVKHTTCALGERTRADRCACELFYKELNDGNIKAGDYKRETRRTAKVD